MFVPLRVNVARISLLILHILLINYTKKKKKKTYKLVSETQNCHDFIEERWDIHSCVQIYILCQLLFEFIMKGTKSNKKFTHK